MKPVKPSCSRALSAFVMLSALVATLAACGPSAPPAPPPMGPLPVSVLEMKPQRVPNVVEVPAQTEGAQEAEVRARVGGVIVKRLYAEGETVKAGQPLFQIDRAPYEIALTEARARADQTAREMARLKPLVEARAVSQREYDDASSANQIAQAALRNAELNLSWTTVSAPVAGASARALKSEGSLVSVPNDALLTTIYQTNPLWARFTLGESELAKLPGGRLSRETVTQVDMVLPDGSVYAKPGRLNFLAANIDTALGAQQLRAEFDNAEHRLLPGQFVRLRLVTGMRDGLFLVPQNAVVQMTEGAVVMTVGPDNKVVPQPVKLGEWRGRDWAVLGGLKAGDRVITDNLIKLRPGMPVAPKAAKS